MLPIGNAYPKTPKNPNGIFKMITPHTEKRSVSDRGVASPNGGITHSLLFSEKKYYLYKKIKVMAKMNPSLANSIYQQKNSKPGLGMECGMMINNRMDSTTGIQKAVETKKMLKRMEKVSVYADAMSISHRM